MNNIIRRIKKSRLFILGAGFSAEAGIPMMDQLLDNTIKIFRLE
jgi:NAD-dependent SIR2 family protein deacetylase